MVILLQCILCNELIDLVFMVVYDFARFVAGGHVTVTSCVNSRERRRNVLCTYGTHTLSQSGTPRHTVDTLT